MFSSKSLYVGDAKHQQLQRLVLSLISVTGRPVCPPFYQPVVVLELVSRRAAEGIFDVTSPVVVAQSLTFFFPKQQNICCQLFHIPGFHGCQAKPPPRAQCMEWMTHTGVEVIGQTIGSVAPRSSVLSDTLSERRRPFYFGYLCLVAHDINHVCCVWLWVFLCPTGIRALIHKSWGLQD